MKKDPNKGYSWTPIIMMFIFFWPIGLFLLIRKLNGDKRASFSSGKKLTKWGWVIIVIGFISIVNGLNQTFFFLLAGFALIYLGKKTRKDAEEYKKYIDLIVNKEVYSIHSIASTIAVTPDVARKDIQKMIDKGLFGEAYLNGHADEIVLMEARASKNHQANHPFEMSIALCSSCGAKNKVGQGQVEHCQYCSSLISA